MWLPTWTWRRKFVSSTTDETGRSEGRAQTTALWKSSRPQNPFESDSVTISSMDSGSIQLAMSESMSDESMMGSGGETLDGRERPDARDLIATRRNLSRSLPGRVGEPESRRTVRWRLVHVTATNKHITQFARWQRYDHLFAIYNLLSAHLSFCLCQTYGM